MTASLWRRGVLAATWLLIVVVTALVSTACRRRSTPPAPATSSSSSVPVRATQPEGVLGELYVAHPDRAWLRFQPLLAAALGFKPVTFSATLTDLLGIPAAYSPNVAVEKPIVGVVVDGDSPRAVIGIRMSSGGELVAALTTGRNPTHRARPAADAKVTLLEPQRRAPVGDLALGVAGNALLVGAHGADLEKYGAYVAFELPRRLTTAADAGRAAAPAPAGSLVLVVPPTALRGPVLARLRSRWQQTKDALERQLSEQRQRRAGRPPDFADPDAALGGADKLATQLLDVLAGAGPMTVVVEPTQAVVEVRIALGAGESNALSHWVRDQPTDPRRALLRLPRETVAAVAVGSTQTGRAMADEQVVAALGRLFGARLGEADRGRLGAALSDLSRGRGDELAIGLLVTREGPGVAIGAPVRDAERLDAGVRGALQALQMPAFAGPLEAFVGHPSVALEPARIPTVRQPATRARVVWTVPADAEHPAPTQLLWVVTDEQFHAALGAEADEALALQVAAGSDPARSLSADERVAAALRRIPSTTSMVMLARPALWGLAESAVPAAPVILSLGTDREELLIRVELDHTTLATWGRSVHRLGFE